MAASKESRFDGSDESAIDDPEPEMVSEPEPSEDVESQPPGGAQDDKIERQNTQRKRWRRILAIVAGVILVPFMIFVIYTLIAGREEEKLEGEIITVPRGTIEKTIEASGYVEMPIKTDLAFRCGAMMWDLFTITWVGVKEGDWVQEEQALARVDPEDLERDVKVSLANLDAAQASYEETVERVRVDIAKLEREFSTKSAELEAAQGSFEDVLSDYDVEHHGRDYILEAAADVGAKTGELGQAIGNSILSIINPGQYRLVRPLGIITALLGWAVNWPAGMAGATGELILKNYGLYAAIDELTDRLEDIENIYAGAELPTNILKAKGELVAAMNSLEDTQHTLEYTLTKKAPADIKKSSSELVGAQTALAEAKERLRDATLVAPFAGIVDEVKEDIHVGSVVSGQDKVITLVDPTQVEVEAIIDEIDVLQVKPGQKARIFLDALPEVEIEGKVRALATLATEEKGVVNYRTWIDIAVPPGIELKHGLTAFVEILVEGKENVLMVPSRAIKMTQRGPVVEVVVDEKTQEQKVVPGISDGVWTEIVEGLVEGETILLP